MRDKSASTLASTIRLTGWRIVVSSQAGQPAMGTPSQPTTETSPGTERPSSKRSTSVTAKAMRSVPTRTASVRSGGR
jgi:hypothetical protein